MKVLVKVALEAVQHVVHVGKSRAFKHLARVNGALAAATNKNDGASFYARNQCLSMLRELRLDIPIWRLLPCDVLSSDWMTHIKKFNFRAHIDENRISVGSHEIVRFLGSQVFHRNDAASGIATRIVASFPKNDHLRYQT